MKQSPQTAEYEAAIGDCYGEIATNFPKLNTTPNQFMGPIALFYCSWLVGSQNSRKSGLSDVLKSKKEVLCTEYIHYKSLI